MSILHSFGLVSRQMEDIRVKKVENRDGAWMEHRERRYRWRTVDQCWLEDRSAHYQDPFLKISDERLSGHILSTDLSVKILRESRMQGRCTVDFLSTAIQRLREAELLLLVV